MALDGPLANRLAQAGGRAIAGRPWFVQQVIDLAAVTVPEIEGHRFRHVDRAEAAARPPATTPPGPTPCRLG